METEFTFITPAAANPRANTINWERRLYHPETRSIVLLNQFSMLSRNLSRSSPATVSITVSAVLTLVLGIFPTASRKLIDGPAAGLFGPRIPRIARAKFRDGMYDGKFDLSEAGGL